MEKRIITTTAGEYDSDIDISLRPDTLDTYIGQDKVKENLRVFIEAAKKRGEPLDHVLLYGPPGLGKTTLSNIIANEMGAGFKTTSGPAIERPGDMAAILNSLNEGARSVRLELPKFTLIGATTRIGLLTAPLRDRFGVVNHLEPYSAADLARIVIRSAGVLNTEIDPGGAAEIARRSRGTPRIANRLLKRVRDFAQVKYDGVITHEVAADALDLLEVDKNGLDLTDRKILLTIIDKFGGGPVGLDTIAAAVNEESETIEDVIEPYLIQLGYIKRTPRGRVVTDGGYRHFGLTKPDDGNSQQIQLDI